VTLLGVIASVLGVYMFIESKVESARPPPPMSGELNIAVARFSAFDDRGHQAPSASAHGLADSVFRFLQPQLNRLKKLGFDIQTRAPQDTGAVDTWSTEQRSQRLAELSDTTNADIVLTAKLISNEGDTTIIPELYAADSKLDGASELEGYHQLGSVTIIGDPDSNMVTRRDLRNELLANIRGSAQFIAGLSFYNKRQYGEAAHEFGIAAPQFDHATGRKLLYIFLGNAAGKQKNWSDANRYYRQALRVDPRYGRAQLGLAELTFQRARGSCERSKANATGLKKAAEMYQDALRQGSPGADLPTKVALGLGRVYICLSQAEVVNGWAQARAQLSKVVEEYTRGNEHFREYAAEAHAALGFTYFPLEGRTAAETQYRRAADEYNEAIRLSLDEQRDGVFYGYLAFAYAGLRDLPKACQAYEQAAQLDPARASRYRKERRGLPGCA
jgi:tetratricopeptide (TPR) repeat protein